MTWKDQGDENLELHTSPSAENTSANQALNHDEIKRRAYEIHPERGGLPGHDLEDWLQAESEFESAALLMRAATGENHRP
jgi:anthranilate phosphoribosyltransferase